MTEDERITLIKALHGMSVKELRKFQNMLRINPTERIRELYKMIDEVIEGLTSEA